MRLTRKNLVDSRPSQRCRCCCDSSAHTTTRGKPKTSCPRTIVVLATGCFVLLILCQTAFVPKQQERRNYKRKRQLPNNSSVNDVDDDAADCPFRDSPLYRKIFVYPLFGQETDQSILTDEGRRRRLNNSLYEWPWQRFDRQARRDKTSYYDVNAPEIQYSTERIVYDMITKSCLQTLDPEAAQLFFVPYFPAMERLQGTSDASNTRSNYATSPYGQALLDLLQHDNYTGWEREFGFVSKYWKRKQGADHILVYSEPLHGLWNPRMKRGNYHYVHSQQQLAPPIAISVEVSTTFVEMYPKCAAKNILVPYPNPDRRWLPGGVYDQQTVRLLEAHEQQSSSRMRKAKRRNEVYSEVTLASPAALPAEQTLAKRKPFSRPATQFYTAGNHGSCTQLRKNLQHDYQQCSASYKYLGRLASTAQQHLDPKSLLVPNKLQLQHAYGMRLATVCPCPGGDSPSAKRHYDAILAGCIPVVLSHDFVWPFTTEVDPDTTLDSSEFSIRLNATLYMESHVACPRQQENDMPVEQLQRLREGVQRAQSLYSYYNAASARDGDQQDNLLLQNVVPTGGAAQALLRALEQRTGGVKWPACRDEQLKPRLEEDPTQFKC